MIWAHKLKSFLENHYIDLHLTAYPVYSKSWETDMLTGRSDVPVSISVLSQ